MGGTKEFLSIWDKRLSSRRGEVSRSQALNALEVGSRSSAYLLEMMGSFSSVFHKECEYSIIRTHREKDPSAQLDARSTRRL